MFLDSGDKNQCCGCMACSQICSVSVIEMKQDEKGFFYPVLDKEKCVNCGRCRKVCPMEENFVGQTAEPDIYAVKNKKEEVLKNSSSGGMFSVLAEWVLAQNGVVYGVAFDESFTVRHMRATGKEQVLAFRGSKYVESDISEVYRSLENDLKNSLTVLLTGTPCQISAVTKYLTQRRTDTEKLYTCDNICHGVPSRKVWSDYLDILKKKYIAADDEITYIHMRSKKVSWKVKTLDIRLGSGNIDEKVNELSFNKLYETLLLHRTSCFNCKYTSYMRLADFSVGDFWNAESSQLAFDIEGGVNTVLVNTEKGRTLFETLRPFMEVENISKEAAWQAHLEYSSKKPSKYEEFWKEYNEASDKEIVICRYMKGSLLTRIIRKMSPVLRKLGLYTLAGKLYKVIIVRKKK